jgi:hypothetical protein
MPPEVRYPKKSDAIDYKNSLPSKLNATVVGVDSDKDGTIDHWEVKTEEVKTEPEFRHRGPNPEELDPPYQKGQRDYLLDLEAAGPPRGETEDSMAAFDDLGYRQGGMSFTERGPISYSKGGAVKGKTFRGSF